jgi:ABC-type bacteriocin/lantibiotic exporter with double-glycine peptidase domain
MTRNPLVIDAAVAVVIVALVLIIEPGVAVAAILALILLAVCGVTYLVGHRSRRRTSAAAPARSRRR